MATRKLEDLAGGIIATNASGISGGVKEIDFNNEKTGINAVDPTNATDLTNKQWVESKIMGDSILETYQIDSGLKTLFSQTTPLAFDFQFDTADSVGNFRIMNQDAAILSVSFRLTINRKGFPLIDVTPDGSAGNIPISISGFSYLTNDGLAQSEQALRDINDSLVLEANVSQLSGTNAPSVFIRLEQYRFLSRTPVTVVNEAVTICGFRNTTTI